MKASIQRKLNSRHNDKSDEGTPEILIWKPKSAKQALKNPCTKVNAHNKKISGNKALKKKNTKGALKNASQELIPKDTEYKDETGSYFGKKKKLLSKNSRVVCDNSLSSTAKGFADIVLKKKKKCKSSANSLTACSKRAVIQKHNEGTLQQEIQFLQQSDINQGSGCMSSKRNVEISHVPEITNTKKKFQSKRKRKLSCSENSNSVGDFKELCHGSSAQNDNFMLDFEGNENNKKKSRKSCGSSFTDLMQNTSHAEALGVSRKMKVVPCVTDKKVFIRSEASENDDVSGYVKLPQKKLRGFDGREDTPERLSRTVFVGNLPLSFNKKLLHALFQSFGEIESVRLRSAVPARSSLPKKVAVIRKQFCRESNSFNGYVVFKNVEDLEQALTLNKVVVQGHHIRVDRFKASVTYDSERSVFVGNLSYDVATESLWSVFGECGSIEAVRIVRDPETGLGKGFGFVLFEECDSVGKALLLNNTQVNGRSIRIKPVMKGNKLKVKTTVEGRTTNIKREKKHFRKSWRSAGHKKTNKKVMRQKIGIQKKKCITAILTQ